MDVNQTLRDTWQTKSFNVKYLAYKFGLTENSVRSIVGGLKGPEKENHSLSAYHRAIGMKLIDMRLHSGLGIQDFAHTMGLTHFRLRELEKGYNEITISEIIRTGLLEYITALDAALLENE